VFAFRGMILVTTSNTRCCRANPRKAQRAANTPNNGAPVILWANVNLCEKQIEFAPYRPSFDSMLVGRQGVATVNVSCHCFVVWQIGVRT
jgi:hypothetical protein